MDVKLADGVTIVRIDHPPVHAFNLELVDDGVATIRSSRGPIARTGARSSDAQVIARQLISMLSPSRTGKLTLT
jgi:hypothetical protein